MKVINLGTPIRAVEIIDELGKKRLANADVRFQNARLKRINELADRNILLKNDLFMDATGLWDLMQEDDGTLAKRHHHHGLSPESIVKALSSLQDPELVAFEYNTYRHIVVTLSVGGRAMLAVIETNAPLRGDRDARINKLVTLYEETKNREPNGALIASLGFSAKNIRQTLLIVKAVEGPDLVMSAKCPFYRTQR